MPNWEEVLSWGVKARTLGGLSWAGTGPSGFAIMADKMPPEKRGLVSAWQSSSGALGGSVGAASGGIMVFYFGWRYLFQMPLIPMLVLWIASLFILPFDQKLESGEAKR